MSDRRPSCKVGVLEGHSDNSEATTHEHDVIDATKSHAGFHTGEHSAPSRRHSSATEFLNLKSTWQSRVQAAFKIGRRLVIFAAAILYLHTCLAACRDAIHLLGGAENPEMNFLPYKSPMIAQFVGSTALRESPLVTSVLKNDTSPRSGTVYLEDGAGSLTPCKSVKLSGRTYGDAFQRWVHGLLSSGAAFNLTFVDASVSELIVPVVDCASSSVIFGDDTSVRFYFLKRMIHDPDDVHLLIMTMSIQEYIIPAQNERGAAAISTVALINDIRATSVEHHFVLALGYPFTQSDLEVFTLEGITPDSFWRLKAVPRDSSSDYAKVVLTARRTGFYTSSENEQSNIRNTIWDLSDDPLTVISTWQWSGRPVLRDSWAWVHFIHLLLAFDVLVNLMVLFVVIYHRLRAGKLWIGDAFVAVSTKLWTRSLLVVISWWISDFWSLTEFCLYTGNVLAGIPEYFVFSAIIRADLLTLYFCLIGLIGKVLKERIDPALTIGLFYVGFEGRVAITRVFTAFYDKVVEASVAEYSLAMSEADPDVESISPLRLWSPHLLQIHDSAFATALLFPIFSTFLVAVVYVAARKVYRFFFPDKLLVQRMTGVSEDEEQLLKLKHNLTNFEIATGAALQNRYGVVADYNNCVYVRGVKFASADGIYSSGYVIANGKFLIQTSDLTSIWLMKILRRRFRNVYVYEVDGTTVKQTARLVYPETIAYRDLVALDIKSLS